MKRVVGYVVNLFIFNDYARNKMSKIVGTTNLNVISERRFLS